MDGEHKSYSEHNEDVTILRLIEGRAYSRYFVDVGANDGYSWSNSYLFGTLGFHLLLVEPILKFAELCQTRWVDNKNVAVEQVAISEVEGDTLLYLHEADPLMMMSSLVAEWPHGSKTSVNVKCVPLGALLNKHHFPKDYACLSIDVEGFEYEVLKSAALDTFRPAVICVEEGNIPKTGAFLESVGYKEVERFGSNGIYARL